MNLPTVKVKHRDGFVIMNESDFDESKHELFVEKKKRGPKPKVTQEDESKEAAE